MINLEGKIQLLREIWPIMVATHFAVKLLVYKENQAI